MGKQSARRAVAAPVLPTLALVVRPWCPITDAGQLRRRLQSLSADALDFIRRPHPDVLHVPDPRDHILLAAELLKTTGASSLMFAETLAACVAYDSDFHCGAPRNAVGQLADRASLIDVVIRVED